MLVKAGMQLGVNNWSIRRGHCLPIKDTVMPQFVAISFLLDKLGNNCLSNQDWKKSLSHFENLTFGIEALNLVSMNRVSRFQLIQRSQ
jgi:hypothetical protein